MAQIREEQHFLPNESQNVQPPPITIIGVFFVAPSQNFLRDPDLTSIFSKRRSRFSHTLLPAGLTTFGRQDGTSNL